MRHFRFLRRTRTSRPGPAFLVTLLAALLALSLAGCGGTPPASSPAVSPTSPAPTAALPAPTGAAVPTAAPLTQPPPAEPTEPPFLEQTSGGLTVRLLAAEDMLVPAPTFTLEGQAPAGTVVSVNEAVQVVGETGAFAVEVPLEEGPNLLEVVASSLQGEEVSFLLTVTYEPSPAPS